MPFLPSHWGQQAASRPLLRLHLLGSPIIFWEDAILTIPRRAVRALLYRLACHSGSLSRGHLHLLFWPDVPEEVARRNLSHLLTHLRRALPWPHILVATSDEVRLQPDHLWCDARVFNQTSVDPDVDLALLHSLVSLYRGPFLDGFDLPGCPEFENWCLSERSDLEHRYLRALEHLVERCASAGEISQAIRYARQYLETDSLAEAIHRQLIQLYAAAGDRHLALQQYEYCASILESELGVSPLPETRAIFQAVLNGNVHFFRPPSPTPLPPLPGAETPLLGREEELRQLEGAFLKLQARRGQVFFISGEAGIGKSRLMLDFAKRHQGVAHLLYGSGHAGEQAIPYQPLLNIFRAILGLEETRALRQPSHFSSSPSLPDFIEPLWLSEIARLLPEVRLLYPELPPPLSLEAESARTRLFDALSHLILSYAIARGPLLLCLDDLQWLDATTRAWLVHIGRYLSQRRCPIMIVGTYRSEEAQEVLDLRHSLARAGVLTELKLLGLKEAVVLELLRYLVGRRDKDEALASRLHQATAGNPFYLVEILRKLIEEGRLEAYCQNTMQFTLPESVREVVQARLQCLSPIAHQVAEAGAILGQSFGIEMLWVTTGRNQNEVTAALDELVARIILVEASREYRFIHEITRQYVEESLGQARGQLLHRRAARAYQRFNPEAYPALAHHFELGGDPQKALDYHGLAAQHAEALFAWREAEEHQSRMLILLDQVDPEHRHTDYLTQRGQVLVSRANQRYLQGRLAERDADLTTLTTLAETSGDETLRLQALVEWARYLNLDAQYEKAIASAEEGLAVAERVNDLPARCHLLNQIGFARYFLGQPQHALAALEAALAAASGEDREIRRHITHTLGYVYFHLGDYARSLTCFEAAYTDHQAVDDYNGMAWGGLDIGATYQKMGKLEEAEQYLTEHLNLARRIGARSAEAYGLIQSGYWEMGRGNYAAAMDLFQEALSMQQELRTEHGRVASEIGAGFACYHLGDTAQARHWLVQAIERARSIRHRRRLAEALIGLGLVELADDHALAAQPFLSEAVEIARFSKCRENLAAGLAALARAERQAGNATGALPHAQEAVRFAHESGLPLCEMWGEMEIGLTLLAQGQLTAALEHTEQAFALLPQAHEGWIGAEEVHQAHAQALQALGRLEAADKHIRRAKAIVEAKASLIPDITQRRRFLNNSLHP